jgi:hypothetical protein
MCQKMRNSSQGKLCVACPRGDRPDSPPSNVASWKKVTIRLREELDFRKSVHHHTIQINQPTRCNTFTSLLLDVYVWLSMYRASPRPSSGAYNCTRSLWFYRWREEAGVLLVVVCQTTTNNAPAASFQR